MSMIENNNYDSAICLEVLEHIPDRYKALKEINRVLKQNGILILSVPHLSRLHEIPNDYYRYTKYGLQVLFNGSCFEVFLIKERAGVFSSNFISYYLNKLFLVYLSYYIDEILPTKRLPAGYTVVAIKK